MIATTWSKVASANGRCLEVGACRQGVGPVVVHEPERVGGDVDADHGPVRREPRAVAAGTAPRVEDALPAPEPRRQQLADERAGVAVPPVVVLDRGDARYSSVSIFPLSARGLWS